MAQSSHSTKWDSIDFSQYLYYDPTSPSALRWKVDVMGGRGYAATLIRSGSAAGSKTV